MRTAIGIPPPSRWARWSHSAISPGRSCAVIAASDFRRAKPLASGRARNSGKGRDLVLQPLQGCDEIIGQKIPAQAQGLTELHERGAELLEGSSQVPRQRAARRTVEARLAGVGEEPEDREGNDAESQHWVVLTRR
jgi:hypothetical protein